MLATARSTYTSFLIQFIKLIQSFFISLYQKSFIETPSISRLAIKLVSLSSHTFQAPGLWQRNLAKSTTSIPTVERSSSLTPLSTLKNVIEFWSSTILLKMTISLALSVSLAHPLRHMSELLEIVWLARMVFCVIVIS